MSQHPRPLRLTAVRGAGLVRHVHGSPGGPGGRLDVTEVELGRGLRSWLRTVRTVLALDPDVVVVLDDRSHRRVGPFTWYAGIPTVLSQELDERDVSRLAAHARRPGAGLPTDHAVSVVVPVLDEIKVVDSVLDPLMSQLRPSDEIVVVDSGSRDGTRERLAQRAAADDRLRVLHVPRCTIAGSRNQGVAAARHDVIACTDAGCVVDPGWLEAFRSAVADCPSPPLLVGVFRAHVGRRLFEAAFAAVAWPDPAELRRTSLPWRLWLRTIGPRFSEQRVDGRSVCFTRETFERAGGFREDLFTAEDEAFGRDAIEGGAQPVLVREASVTWFQRPSVRLAFRQFRGYGRGAATGGSAAQRRIDAIRLVGYLVIGGSAAAGGRSGRRTAGVMLTGLLLFPALRLARRRESPLALPLLLPAQLVKDAGKLTGTFEALALGRSGPLARPE